MSQRRSDRLTDLGELQLRVLDILGRIGEGTVYDVLEQFPEPDRPRYTTALTVLRSLEKKGLATHHTVDRAYLFRPLKAPEEVRGCVLRDLVQRVFGGSPTRLVAALLGSEEVTPEALQEMRRLIAEKEQGAR